MVLNTLHSPLFIHFLSQSDIYNLTIQYSSGEYILMSYSNNISSSFKSTLINLDVVK